MQEYLDDPSLLMGKRIDRKDTSVVIKDLSTKEITEVLEFASIQEAKEADCALTCAKFAFGLSAKDTKYRQAFAYGEGGQASQQHTGWTKTS